MSKKNNEKHTKDPLAAARRAKLRVEEPNKPVIPPYDILRGKAVSFSSGDIVFGSFGCGAVSWHKIYTVRAAPPGGAGEVLKFDPDDLTSDVCVIRFLDRAPEEIAAACNFAGWALLNYAKPARRRMTQATFTSRFAERLGFVPVGDPGRVSIRQLKQWLVIAEEID